MLSLGDIGNTSLFKPKRIFKYKHSGIKFITTILLGEHSAYQNGIDVILTYAGCMGVDYSQTKEGRNACINQISSRLEQFPPSL